jgi:hypothetical protein
MRGRKPNSFNKDSMLISLPMYARYLDWTATIDEIYFERLIVKMKDEKNTNDIKALVLAFREHINQDNQKELDINTANFDILVRIDDIIETVFDTIIAITMFLCFFSLSSSMTANLFE